MQWCVCVCPSLPLSITCIFILSGWCSTPTLLLICSSLSRENGYPLLIFSSLSTAQLWRIPRHPQKGVNFSTSFDRPSLAPSFFQEVAMMGALVLRKFGIFAEVGWHNRWRSQSWNGNAKSNQFSPRRCWCLSSWNHLNSVFLHSF